MRLLIVGDGRMGRTLARLAAERGHEVAGMVGEQENADGRALEAARLAGVDVALEFTVPTAAARNIERLITAGVPVVCGTTGWHSALPRIAELVEERRGALLHSANFSTGVHLFLRVARELARTMAGRPGFTAHITETHHAQKLDAPSGTALALQRAAQLGDAEREIPVNSVRGGFAPGTHELVYDAPLERLALVHEARGRDVFAAGALDAAAWLPGRRGIFTFEQMLFGSA